MSRNLLKPSRRYEHTKIERYTDGQMYKMYSNKILNVQESTTILKARTKKSGNLLNARRTIKNSFEYLTRETAAVFIS